MATTPAAGGFSGDLNEAFAPPTVSGCCGTASATSLASETTSSNSSCCGTAPAASDGCCGAPAVEDTAGQGCCG